MVPVGYANWRFGHGLGLDASASFTSALSIDGTQLTRAGLGLSVSVFWGPDTVAPRLVSAGVMLHAAGGSHRDRPVASVIASLNLSTLYDLTGGR